MKQTVIINVGCSGSGKSTWSTQFIKNHPEFVRINRDDIRRMLKGTLEGYYKLQNLNKTETLINNIEGELFGCAISEGNSIIIDNTNLKQSYINKWINLTEAWNQGLNPENQAEVNFAVFMEGNVLKLKERVGKRDSFSSWKDLAYIDKQFQLQTDILKYLNDTYEEKIIYKHINGKEWKE